MSSLRLRNIVLLAAGLTYRAFRGHAKKPIVPPSRALIIQLAKMGDMVCTTPMFRAIKQAYPQCKVYVVGDGVNKEILADNHDIDHYLVYKKNIFGLIKALRKIRPDFGCVTGPSPEALAMLYLSGIPCIATPVIENGFSPQETKAYKLLRRFVIAIPHRMGHYAAREYLRLLEPIGILADDTKKHLAFSKEAEGRIARFFSEKRILPGRDFVAVIFPSTGYAIKQWPPERFAEVADYLYRKYQAKIIIPGNGEDKKQIDEMVSHLAPATKAVNAYNKFGIDELKALISKMSLFLSVDTGPIYIAEAFGVPTVNIVGPMDEREQPAQGRLHRVVRAERREPMMHIMNTSVFDLKEAKRQTEEITAEMVIAAVNELTAVIELLRLNLNNFNDG